MRFKAEQTVGFSSLDDRVFGRTVGMLAKEHEFRTMDRDFKVNLGAVKFDAFNALHKSRPEVTEYGRPLDRDIVTRILDSAKYRDLHSYTIGDSVSAIMAGGTVIREVFENLPPSVKDAAKDQSEKEEAAKDAESYAEALSEDEHADEGDIDSAYQSAKEAREAAGKATEKLQKTLRGAGAAIQQAVDRGMGEASEKCHSMRGLCNTFGVGLQDAGGGLSVEEKMKLAELVESSGMNMRRFVDMLGRFNRDADAARLAKSTHAAGAIVDVTIGDDIDIAMDEEISELVGGNNGLALLAQLRLADAEIMQYECEAEQPMNRGDIVLLFDESGSMAGQREAEAKAFTLAMIGIAGKANRTTRVLFFQSEVTFEAVISPADPMTETIEKMLAIARRGTGGGTSFDAPLRRVCDTISASERVRADSIMITDGCGPVNSTTIDRINNLRVKTGMRFFALLIDGQGSMLSNVKPFADEVWVAPSLTAGGKELFAKIG